MSTQQRLIIIGGGIAGITAASSARRQWPGARIAVLEASPHAAYNKIALGAFAAEKSSKDRLRLLPRGTLERQRVELAASAPVTEIAPKSREVTLEDGRKVAYDELILATGARPVLPPIDNIDAPGVMPLWSMADALRVRQSLPKVHRITVVGGGVLGVEMAAALRESGREVTIVEAEKELLPGLLDAAAGELYTKAVRAFGVALSLGDPVAAIARTLQGLEVRTAGDAVFSSDMVLVTAGVTPRVELARKAGLTCRSGVVVDRFLRTSDPHILACGNCVELDGRLQPLWNPAVAQAEIAGINAFGGGAPYAAAPPILHVKTPRMPLFVCGDGPGGPGATVLRHRTEGAYRAVELDGDRRVTYAVFFGDTSGAQAVGKAAATGAPAPAEAVRSGDVEALLRGLDVALNDERDKSAWTCRTCGYVHEGDAPPQLCPVCAVGPDQFLAA